jgi:hypothetical protein
MTVEREMAVTLPDKYKAFMMRFGGGTFGFVELFPLAPVTSEGGYRRLGTFRQRTNRTPCPNMPCQIRVGVVRGLP